MKKMMSEAFEQEIKDLVQSIIRDSNKEVSEKDVKKIMKKAIPDINEIISKQIKRHFVELAQYVIDNFKEKE